MLFRLSWLFFGPRFRQLIARILGMRSNQLQFIQAPGGDAKDDEEREQAKAADSEADYHAADQNDAAHLHEKGTLYFVFEVVVEAFKFSH